MGVVLEVLGFSDDVVIGAVVGLLGLVIGSYLVYTGVMHLGRGWNIMTHDPIPAGEVHLADATVEVQGEARPIGEPVTAPYTGTECVAYTYEKKEKHRRHTNDGQTRTKWRTIDSGGDREPFRVVDDSGAVAVDPDGATLSLNDDVVDRHGDIKEIEGRLDVGETVHVYGQKCDTSTDAAGTGDAGTDAAGTGDAGTDAAGTGEAGAGVDGASGGLGGASVYVGAGDDPDAFSIADTSENWTIVRYLAAGTGSLVLGIAFVLGVAVLVLAYTAGGLEHVSLPYVEQFFG